MRPSLCLQVRALHCAVERPCLLDVGATDPINIFQEAYRTTSPPFRLSYHNASHYNSIIDPAHPSVGVGLGLPQSDNVCRRASW